MQPVLCGRGAYLARPRHVGSGQGIVAGRRLWLLVLLAGLIVFAVLALTSWLIYDDAEQNLLEQRTDEASSVLEVSVANIKTPLDGAAMVARVTDGDPDDFAMSLEDRVGIDSQFTAVGLFRIGSDRAVATIGDQLALEGEGTAAIEQLVRSAAETPFVIVDLLDRGRTLGYAVVDDPDDPRYVVYAERTLSPDPNVRRRTDEPFSGLDYAIYLGEEAPDNLLGSSVRELPIEGRRATKLSDFGDQQLLLVMAPIGTLSGWLSANLWWLVLLVGAGLSLVAAWLTRRLGDRREEALQLARENAGLYDEQRHIAETLQIGLLPQELTPPPGGEIAARYWPAGEASLIGGDFYDAFRVDDDRWAVAIGDVCGKGIDAAAITGLVRHTLRAAARASISPSAVLADVHRALRDHRPTTFCTVCFFYVTVDSDGTQKVTISLGGHPAPLLRNTEGGVVEIGQPGSLLGIFDPQLTDVVVAVHPGDTIVLYTDGLTDAPHDQAVPLEELIELVASEGDLPADELADNIRPLKRRRRPHGSGDDTAVVVLRLGAIVSPQDDPDSLRVPVRQSTGV